jgi:competence protein ComEA
MSSTANTQLQQGLKPAAHAERLCPWPVSVRVLLIVVTMIGAMCLRMASLRMGSEGRGPFRAAPVLVVDPNSAPPEVLRALPHVGGALVKKIVEQRAIRPFQSLGDLRHRVRGLGPATLARLSPHLRIGPSGQPNFTQDDRHSLIAAVPSRPRLSQGPGDSDVR